MKNGNFESYSFFSFSESFNPHEPQRKPHESSNSVTCQSDRSFTLQSIQLFIPKSIVSLCRDFVFNANPSNVHSVPEFPSCTTSVGVFVSSCVFCVFLMGLFSDKTLVSCIPLSGFNVELSSKLVFVGNLGTRLQPYF